MSQPTQPIQVLARFVARPDRLNDLERLLRGLLAPTRAESGCIRYELWRSRLAPLEFCIVEEWRSEADLDAHLGLPHLVDAKAKLPALLGAPLVIERLDRVG